MDYPSTANDIPIDLLYFRNLKILINTVPMEDALNYGTFSSYNT